MNFLELAKNRYTTKSYRNEKISEDKIQELKEILHLAPSSINCQPWKFYFIDNQDTKNALAKVSFMNEERVKQASHLVIFSVIDDIELFESQMSDYITETAIDFYNKTMKTRGVEAVKKLAFETSLYFFGIFLNSLCINGHRLNTYGRY